MIINHGNLAILNQSFSAAFAGGLASAAPMWSQLATLVPSATATTLKAVGVSEHRADNTGGAAGAIRVRCRKGPHRFANSAAADAIALTDVGSDCYIVDDQTVAKTNGTNTRSVAGKVFDVDADGVWVDFR